MVVKMHHRDLGDMGSEFIVIHPRLKHRALFLVLFLFTVVTAFFFGIHLMDETILGCLCLVLIVSLIFKLAAKVYSENLLILPSLGLQVETTYYLGFKVTQFIHRAYIKDIIINEAVTMHSIMHYLLVLLENSQSDDVQILQPLFEPFPNHWHYAKNELESLGKWRTKNTYLEITMKAIEDGNLIVYSILCFFNLTSILKGFGYLLISYRSSF